MNKVTLQGLSIGLLATVLLLALVAVSGVATPPEPFFEIHLAVTAGNSYYVDLGEVFKAELAKIGISLRVESVEWTSILARARRAAAEGLCTFDEGGYDLFFVALSGGAFEPGGVSRYTHTKSRGSFNVWNYYNPLLDEQLDLAASQPTIEERQPYYWEAARILLEDQPLIILDYPGYVYVFPKGWEGLQPYKVNIAVACASFWQMTFNGAPAPRMIVAEPSGIRCPNPLFDWTGPGKAMIGSLVFNSLVVLDEELRPLKPDLAQSWEISEDGKTFVFKLRDDVYWHDGTKFTSRDVKFSFEARMDPATGAEHHSKFLSIESVEIPDDYTVVVHLKDLYAPFLFDVGTTAIVPAHVFEGLTHEELANSPYSTGAKSIPGTGPMQLVEWKKGESIHLKANPEYFEGEPTVGEIIFLIIPSPSTALAALEAGEVDALTYNYAYTVEVPRLRDDPRYTVVTYPSLATRVLGVNTAHPILANKWVRQAISYAIPRKELTETVGFGLSTPGSQFLGPWSWGHNPNLPEIEYSIEKAKECMEKAGYRY